MIEISPSVFILIVEALVLVFIALSVVAVLSFRRSGKRRAAVTSLAAQIRKQSEVRAEETGSFLREIYQLDDEELKKTIRSIDKGEKSFYQKLINSYLQFDARAITSMDAAVAELIDVYKELKPRISETETVTAEENQQLLDTIKAMNEQNNNLKQELEVTKAKMDSMLSEFGNMFGGGKDHELEAIDVTQKVKIKPDKITKS